MMNKNLPMNNRVDWIDYAKGICIIWVVTLYCTEFVQLNTETVGWMQHVADFAQPFRMPDFFLLAGLFVSRVINRPWRAYIDSKVLYFVYFYAIWVTLKFVNMEWRTLLGPDRLTLLPDYLRLYVEPPTGPLWFIFMLPVFFIAVRLLRSLPVMLVMAVAVALQIGFTNVELSVKVFDKFVHYFVYFYAGYAFARYVFRSAAWAQSHMRQSIGLFIVWFAVNTIMVALGWASLPGILLVMGFVGAFAIMLFATLLARLPWMAWLRYLGQHSIVVYLAFVIPLGLMRRLIVSPKLNIDSGTMSLIVTVLSVAGAVLIYWAVRNTPLRFMFSRPAWTSIVRTRDITGKEGAAV
jgi:uncharacterized membrane protein YcfT